MRSVVFISNTAILLFVLSVTIIGFFEKKNVFELFIKGCKDGVKVIWNIFPSLLALIVSVGMLRSCGVVDFIGNLMYPVLKLFNIEKELIPLILLRPISASTTTAIATDIMQSFGVDSKIGLIASTIMGSTETTLYTIAIYTSSVGVRKTRFVLLASLLADIAGMSIAVMFWRFLS